MSVDIAVVALVLLWPIGSLIGWAYMARTWKGREEDIGMAVMMGIWPAGAVMVMVYGLARGFIWLARIGR